MKSDTFIIPPHPHTRPIRELALTLCIATLLTAGCVEAFLGEDVPNTPEDNFEVFWGDMNRYYALFDFKNVNWDSLYAVYRPEVGPSMSNDELFSTLCAMIAPLDDGHVIVQSETESCISNRITDLPPDDLRLRVIERFLEEDFAFSADGRLQYGRILDSGKTLGYLYIQSFAGDGAPVASWVKEVDHVLEELSDVDGLILDVRSNSGGNGFNAADLAGRFTDVSRPYLVTQTRNGPELTDFTSPRTWSIEPKGTSFSKPVVLLTNRRTFSAAEWFVMGMQTMPLVTVLGDYTGGGLSSRLFRTLPNGWSFSISIQRVTSLDGVFYEGTGIEPDTLVIPTRGAIVQPDVILREAIERMTNDE